MSTTAFARPQAVAAHNLIHEQLAIIQAFRTGMNLKITAFAGTGKTSTLTAMARSVSRRGLALAFSKDAAEDLKARMPTSVEARTTHSLSWGHCRRLGFGETRMRTNFVAAFYPPLRGSSVLFQQLVSGGLKRFHRSADRSPVLHHVPDPNRLIVDPAARLSAGEAASQCEQALGWIIHIWQEQQLQFSTTPIGGDGYVKLWAASNPRLGTDFILLDEGQDTNAVVQAVFAAQQCQKVVVGDRHQQMYDWRGARDALSTFGWFELPLTQSWRFGPELAEAATDILETLDETRPLRGNPNRSTAIVPEGHAHAVLCRTNAGCFAAAVAALEAGVRPFAGAKLAHGLKALVEDAQRLDAGMPATSPDLLGITSSRGLIDFAGTEEGAHLKMFARLIERHGAAGLSRLLASFAGSRVEAGVSISTCHRAKGLEWPSVRIGTDFARGERITDAERRLFYVAITRAKDRLIIDPALLAEYQRSA
jgi:hypothetical protein